jgi:hypothetical protein
MQLGSYGSEMLCVSLDTSLKKLNKNIGLMPAEVTTLGQVEHAVGSVYHG